MTREEFSKMVADARKNCEKTLIEVCSQTKMLPKDIYRIEKAEHNYNLKKCMELVNVCNAYCIISTCGFADFKCTDYDKLIEIFVQIRKHLGTQISCSKKYGVARSTLNNIENKYTIVSIDTFLKIANSMGITIKIEQNG